MRKYYDLIIYIFLLISPLIDALTGLQERFNIPFSVGVIIRGLIMFSAFIYLYYYKKNRNNIYLFLIYIIIECIYTFAYLQTSIFTEIKNVIIIFYLPIMVLFFSNYENKKIDKSLIATISFMYLFLILIPYLFGFGFNTYSGADGKSAYLGLFYEGNELSALLILLLPLTVRYLLDNKNYLYLAIYLVLYALTIILVGTKVLLLGTFVVIMYFAFKFIMKFEKKKRVILYIFLLMFIGICIAILPFTPVYKNLVISMDYYGVKSIFDLFKPKFIDNIIFSNRINFAINVFKVFGSSVAYIVFGIGKTLLLTLKDVEIDLIDIFYSIGVLGTLIYVYSFNKNIFNLKGIYKFTFILLFIISLFSGHVLIKPMVSTFLGVLFILNKEELEI